MPVDETAIPAVPELPQNFRVTNKGMVIDMRMRRKKHGPQRIQACAALLINDLAHPDNRPEDPATLFPERHPLHLEIGCGKGSFAVGMAAAHPEWNFIAMERVPDVCCLALEKARDTATDRPGDNLRFLIGDAGQLLTWFRPGSVSRIYLNFSDPWPKKGYAKRRLTHRNFLAMYRHILCPGGEVWLKTDNQGLYFFSLEEFAYAGLTPLFCSEDFHKTPEAADNVMTEYETAFSAQGMPIYCARMRF